jgi:CheY-like chemotaxis protein
MAALGDVEALAFESPQAFWRALEESPDLLGRLTAVITDMWFEGDVDGLDLCRKLKAMRSMPVILCSESRPPRSGEFDLVVDKEPIAWEEIEGLMRVKADARIA